MVDISFSGAATELLKGIIGKTFDFYSCDPFEFSPSVFGIVGIKVEDKFYKLTCNLEKTIRFWNDDEVAQLRFEECGDQRTESRMDGGTMIDMPVRDTIVGIDVINDLEAVTFEGEERTFQSTKGIIFRLSSGNEISFEVDTWFSEMITIQRGYNLIDKFTPVDDFLEEWEDCKGYTATVERTIVSLK